MKPVIFPVITFILAAIFLTSSQIIQAAPLPTVASAKETEACAKNLKLIYEGIQAYRRDHKDLPNWLSDLVPKYIADASILICPVTRRTGVTKRFGTSDPQMATSYIFEFCAQPIPSELTGQAGWITMREYKSLQMALVGGEVPILRCHLHSPVLNVGFDGKFYESQTDWEKRFADVIDFQDLFTPAKVVAKFVKGAGPKTAGESNEGVAPRAGPREPESNLLGKPGPSFKLELLGGGQLDLASQKDKTIVILDFWATWCGPCRAALPGLVALSEEYKDKGVVFYGVNLREEPSVIRKYLEKSKLQFGVALDGDGHVGQLYGVTGIPQTVIVGKDGTVQALHIGYSPEGEERLKQELESLLAGKKLAAPAAGRE